MFFSVPNRGLNIDALRSMVEGQPNSRLVEDLDPESLTLRLLHREFSDHFRFEDSPIISIFETKRTKTVVVILPATTSHRGKPIHIFPYVSPILLRGL